MIGLIYVCMYVISIVCRSAIEVLLLFILLQAIYFVGFSISNNIDFYVEHKVYGTL